MISKAEFDFIYSKTAGKGIGEFHYVLSQRIMHNEAVKKKRKCYCDACN